MELATVTAEVTIFDTHGQMKESVEPRLPYGLKGDGMGYGVATKKGDLFIGDSFGYTGESRIIVLNPERKFHVLEFNPTDQEKQALEEWILNDYPYYKKWLLADTNYFNTDQYKLYLNLHKMIYILRSLALRGSAFEGDVVVLANELDGNPCLLVKKELINKRVHWFPPVEEAKSLGSGIPKSLPSPLDHQI
jgi:hypothetical protein